MACFTQWLNPGDKVAKLEAQSIDLGIIAGQRQRVGMEQLTESRYGRQSSPAPYDMAASADSPGLLQRLAGSDQAQFGTFGGKRCVGMQLEAGNVVLAADDQAWARGECDQCRGAHQYIAIALSLDAKAEIIAAPLL